MWNDTDIPLAYLITIRTYGTWLHGDERGSTNRFRNRYGSRHLPKEESWLKTNKSRMAAEPILLDARMRDCVRKAIKETCFFRNWLLYAINVRTNHAHTVVAIGSKKPEIALNAFKANATREMRAAGLVSPLKSRGRTKAVSGACGMKITSTRRSNMFYMGKGMICRRLSDFYGLRG